MTEQHFPSASILGYPRIGVHRELKRVLEDFWSGKTSGVQLVATANQLRCSRTERLHSLGLTEAGSIPEDFSYYDQVLDIIAATGAVPTRFSEERKALAAAGPDLWHASDSSTTAALEALFTIARGEGARPALEMTKWFDSNYHYLVPEIGPETKFEWLGSTRSRAAALLGEGVRPVLVGPVTFLLLSKPSEEAGEDYDILARLPEVLSVYEALIDDLVSAGASWVQFDEPALTSDRWAYSRERIIAALTESYERLSVRGASLLVALTYGHAFDAVEALAATKVQAVAIDLVKGKTPDAQTLAAWNKAWAGRTIAAGIVSGRNVWRTNLRAALGQLRELKENLGQVHLAVTTSTSLQHVPIDVEKGTKLDPQVASWLAFADQKVEEVVALAKGLEEGDEAIEAELAASDAAVESRQSHPGVRRAEVRERTAAVTAADRERAPYAERAAQQAERLHLPVLPTTTIGSFPQTVEIRKARAAHRRGELSAADYEQAMKAEIEHVVRVQERIGLDVLVHGEAERNDMVQYFAENLEGFATTVNGWVQSYGSRCTRPSILWGDVVRPAPITVKWSSYAQSLTDKPLKGMLTGPVTIMAWSFVRDDEAPGEVADQIGLALRDEIADLEEAGIPVVQVDEPAIRELLPLRKENEEEYLQWSVGAFRLATGGAQSKTQVHTHLCYSDFKTVIDAVDRLDADVTSIEASRSRMEILPAIRERGFERGLGPGVWDIHSPRVPQVEEIVRLLQAAVSGLGIEKLWGNPDCGLKTRAYTETIPSLENLVAAAKQVRQRHQ